MEPGFHKKNMNPDKNHDPSNKNSTECVQTEISWKKNPTADWIQHHGKAEHGSFPTRNMLVIYQMLSPSSGILF